jgi:hypothetical protein
MIINQGEILSKKLRRFSCNISVIFSDFNQNYNVAINFPTTAKHISQNSIWWEKRPPMQADGRTHMTSLRAAFFYIRFANAPKS